MSRPSPFFARFKADVLRVMAAVSAGRLVTFKNVGAHLDVASRHVAYVLGRLSPEEQARVPWHRCVPDDGVLRSSKSNAFEVSQEDPLRAEGVKVSRNVIAALNARVVSVSELADGLAPQARPPHAPMSKPRRRKPSQ